MISKNNNDRLLLVTGSPSTQQNLSEQLLGILPKEIEITPFCVDRESNPSLEGTYFTVFSSAEVYDDFLALELSAHIGQYIIGTRTVLGGRLDQVLALPRDQKILMVTDSKRSAEESISHLKDIGFDFLHFLPYYPGCNLSYKPGLLAVTTGDLAQIPPGIDKVYNIGTRPFDFATVVRIMAHYSVLEEKLESYAQQYLDTLLSFAKRISNAADEASKVMKTVRTALMGTGYYAKYHFDDIIGETPVIRKVKDAAAKIAHTNLSVLIEGDNGTGKELLASAIHNASDRASMPFIAVNFSALPDQLIESELFGYEEGAFTGAKKGGKIGLFQQAEGGTIFLDEIGDISLKMQAKLLRVLQEKEIMKIGGDRIIPVDVRIIAATNRNLKQMIEEKTFRKDLYYRIKEGYLYLPSLAERKEDIPLLINHFMETIFCSSKEISADTLHALKQREWAGNIRELLNVMKFTLAVSEKDVITPDDLPYDGPHPSDSRPIRDSFKVTDDVSLVILAAIREINQRSEIAGRNRIYWFLHDNGYEYSEYKIRKCISALSEQGLVSATHGKYGLALTDKGLMILETQR